MFTCVWFQKLQCIEIKREAQDLPTTPHVGNSGPLRYTTLKGHLALA
jgi:hypothetical protein